MKLPHKFGIKLDDKRVKNIMEKVIVKKIEIDNGQQVYLLRINNTFAWTMTFNNKQYGEYAETNDIVDDQTVKFMFRTYEEKALLIYKELTK